MNDVIICLILSVSVSVDALCCGFSAGASGIKIPFTSALSAAFISAVFVAAGSAAGKASVTVIPPYVQKYISFFVLAGFGISKLIDCSLPTFSADINKDKTLSVSEGAALGSAISVDGLAAGFGNSSGGATLWLCSAFTFLFTALLLYLGGKSGKGAKGGFYGNAAAGIALSVIAAEKLICG